MEPFLVLITIAIGGAVFVALANRSQDSVDWRLVAERLGLDLGSDPFPSEGLAGRVDGIDVKIELVTMHDDVRTRYTVGARARMTRQVAIERRRILTGLGLVAEEVETGDVEFDRAFRVLGPESVVLAVLGERTRAILQTFSAKDECRIEDEAFVLERSGSDGDAEAIVARVRQMIDVARAFCLDDDDVGTRLAENVETEVIPALRLRNLEHLTAFHANSDACPTAVRVALNDRDERLRLHAAKTIGAPEGSSVLEALAVDASIEPSVQMSALSCLANRYSRKELGRVIEALLGTSAVTVEVHAIGVAAEERIALIAPRVEARLTADDPRVVVAAARALAAFGEGHAKALASLLDHGDDTVKVAACDGLARIGTVEMVEPLLEHTTGISKGSDLKRAARAPSKRSSRDWETGTAGDCQ